MSKDFFKQFKYDDDEKIPQELDQAIEEVDIEEPTDESGEDPVEEPVIEVTSEVEIEEDDSFSFSPFVESLVESDILFIDPSKEYDDSEDGFRQVIEDTVEQKFQGVIKSLPEKIQRIIDLGLKGADIDELIQHESQTDYRDVDIEDSDNQILLIQEYHEVLGIKPEASKKKLEKLQDMGDQEEEAKIAHEYLIEWKDRNDQKFIKEQEAKIAQSKIDSDNILKSFEKEVMSTEEIAGFKVSKADRLELYNYITKPVKKVNGEYLTQQEVDTRDKEHQLRLSYFAMKKFDLSDIEKKITTKKTIDVKKQLSRFSDTNARSKSGATVTQPKENVKIKSTFFNYSNRVED